MMLRISLALLASLALATCSDQVEFQVVNSGIENYPQKATVFGVPLLATPSWTQAEINHVASILAKYIDNDEDGCPDDPNIMAALLKPNHAGKTSVLMLLDSEHDADKAQQSIQPLGYSAFGATPHDQVKMECSGLNSKFPAGAPPCLDSSMEEVFHFFTSFGSSTAYPEIFGQGEGGAESQLTKAMDKARGGQFKDKAPKTYPKGAWYTYAEESCTYPCQAAEYVWWAYCAYSGICDARKDSDHVKEFKYMTKKKLTKGDKMVAKLLKKQSGYVFPTQPANGKYKGSEVCSIEGAASIHDEEPALSECDLISIYIQQLAAENGISSIEEVKMLIETHNLDWKSMITEATGQAIPEEYSFDDVLAHLLNACPDLAQLLA